MAKKFGKILLFTAAVTTAAAAAVYYLQKKDSDAPLHDGEDEDYDDFSDELDDDTDAASRSYVPLHREGAEHSEASDAEKAPGNETSANDSSASGNDESAAKTAADQEAPIAETASEAIEKVEEFFGEEDSE